MPRCTHNACRRWMPSPMHKRTGLIVDGRWFCSSGCLEGLARRRLLAAEPAAIGLPAAATIRLGVWLQHQGVLGADGLREALEAQHHTGLRLGAQLQALGLVSADLVLRGLARQAGVGYFTRLAPSMVAGVEDGLSADAARALSLAPFQKAEHGRVKVACPAPLPRTGLAAFRRLTGLAPEPYLVTDENWEELLAACGTAVPDAEAARFLETRDLSEAVATITAAVASGRHARITEARFDPYTWVRVQGAGVTHDVVLASAG